MIKLQDVIDDLQKGIDFLRALQGWGITEIDVNTILGFFRKLVPTTTAATAAPTKGQ